MSAPPSSAPSGKVYSSRVVIAGVFVPAALAVLLFAWWPRPAPSRPRAVPTLPGDGASVATRTLGALELGAMRGWVYLGEYRNARWVTRKFGGWAEGLPAAGTAITALEAVSLRDGAPDAAGALAPVTGQVEPGETLAIVQLRAAEDGGAVWARVASPR